MPIGVYKRTKRQRELIRLSRIGQHHSKETCEKIRLSATGRFHSKDTINKLSGRNNHNYGKSISETAKQKMRIKLSGAKHPNYGKHPSEETRRKMSVARIGKSSPNKGKAPSSTTIQRMRVSALRRVLRNGIETAIGKNEKTILDKQEQIDEVIILRQYPIQKLGYIVDGYCSETNTVYEVYEKYHDYQVQKDLQRETEICNLLSCNFHIIWDR